MSAAGRDTGRHRSGATPPLSGAMLRGDRNVNTHFFDSIHFEWGRYDDAVMVWFRGETARRKRASTAMEDLSEYVWG